MRDWHAERYAAGETLAKVAREVAADLSAIVMLIPSRSIGLIDRLERALAEYERTKDAP